MKKRFEMISDLLRKIEDLTDKKELYLHSVDSALSMNVRQNTITDSIFLSERNFTETTSSSMFLSTAIRTYDNHDGMITEYKGKTLDEMRKALKTTYDYDEYICRYGKLPKIAYGIKSLPTEKDCLFNECYAQDASDSTTMQGLFMEDVNENTITEIREETNLIHIGLDTRKALLHMSVSLKNNGSFDSYPTYKEAEMDFLLNEKKEIISIISKVSHKIKWGFMTLNINQETKTDIHEIKNKKILVNGKELSVCIPEPDEIFSTPIPASGS